MIAYRRMKMKKCLFSLPGILMATIMCASFTSCGGDDVTPPIIDTTDSNNSQKTTGYVNGHEYVDLGLSVKWAKANIGASSSEKYGNYYAWGETGTKYSYYVDTYKYYNTKTGSFMSIGSNISGTKYDAATYYWGSKWRMPTKTEMDELLSKCTWEWTIVNSIAGFQVKGKNGNSIFLPAGGCNTGTDKSAKAGLFGQYWTGTFKTESDFYSHAFGLVFTQNKYHLGLEGQYRESGLNIRPVTSFSDEGEAGNGNGNGTGESDVPYVISFTFTATKNSILVYFMASEKPTKATIKYGEFSATNTLSTTITNKQISAKANGLKAGTKYYFKCTVSNSKGSSTSDEYPAITNY